MVIRLAEVYLIRAEAERYTRSAGLNAALADINIIRHRAGLSDYNGPFNNKDSVLASIMHERQVELFTEWGHRWFDLIRTKKIDAVMGNPGNVSIFKGGIWNHNWALMPLPYGDLQIDPNLTQNPDY